MFCIVVLLVYVGWGVNRQNRKRKSSLVLCPSASFRKDTLFFFHRTNIIPNLRLIQIQSFYLYPHSSLQFQFFFINSSTSCRIWNPMMLFGYQKWERDHSRFIIEYHSLCELFVMFVMVLLRFFSVLLTRLLSASPVTTRSHSLSVL